MNDIIQRTIAPPKEVVLAGRAVLGSIDLDPWSTVIGNKLVQAARYYNRDQESIDDVCARDWTSFGENRIFLSVMDTGAVNARRLLHKLLREYRKGTVREALVWIQHNETMVRLPWLWDFPICMPFRRLRYTWFDEVLEEFRTVSPAAWSPVIYMPPTEDTTLYHTKVGRFSSAFSPYGRIIFNEDAESDDWEKSYKAFFDRSYNYRE